MKKKTIEDYVELLFELEKNKSPVQTNDIANKLRINPSSVTEIFQKLNNEGYVNYEKYIGVTLTDKGKKVAQRTRYKHDALRDFLIFLGLKDKIAEKDACEIEHVLHPETMDLIIKFVEFIKYCKITPFWLRRFKKYVQTGKRTECPSELVKICNNFSKKSKCN